MNAVAIFQEWNRCRHWLVPALVDHTEDEVINDLLLHRAQLWGGSRAALVTQLVAGDEPYVLVWLGGGDMFELLAMAPVLECWARCNGAKAVRINGRKGWARVLRGAGFQSADGELRKVL